jgi:hypothetical protein
MSARKSFSYYSMRAILMLFVLALPAAGVLGLASNLSALADVVEPAQSAEPLPLKEVVAKVEFVVEPEELVVKGKQGVRIKVKNNCDRALIFNGEMATAKIGETKVNCMDNQDFDEMFASPATFASNWSIGFGSTVSDALSIGSWQTVNDMLKSKSFKRYGKDEERRQQDEERFGQRILWPGDSSSGYIFFPAEQSLSGAELTLPVSSFFNSKDQAEVVSTTAHH